MREKKMAKIYESGDISLKIDNLRKTHFLFYKAGDDEAIGEINISRSLKEISLIVYKQFYNQTEETYTNISKCYNQFVHAHSKFGNYGLSITQFNPNPEQKIRHDLPFQLYAIKKDLNSPINLVREETLEELNRQGIQYYSYYDPDCFMNIKNGSKKLICKNRTVIKPFSGLPTVDKNTIK